MLGNVRNKYVDPVAYFAKSRGSCAEKNNNKRFYLNAEGEAPLRKR